MTKATSYKPSAASQINAIKSLEEKQFFKLVCGASLNDLLLIENLSFLFTLAGADVIDLASRADAVLAARKGIQKAIKYRQQTIDNGQHMSSGQWSDVCCPLIMASIQVDKDPHFRKVVVNYDKCDLCGACVKVCPTEAFDIRAADSGQQTAGGRQQFVYKPERCFGCDLCPKVCHVSALSMAETDPTPVETLQEMVLLGVDAIEFHFGKNYERLAEIWHSDNKIKALVKDLKLLSFSIGSELLSENEIKKTARLCYELAGSGVILQCDGKPMSGSFGKNGNNTDNSSLNVASIIQRENLPVYLQLSGGTTEHTYKNAKNANLDINGVALGSYARKLLMPYLSNLSLLEEKRKLDKAVDIAKRLVNSVKRS